MAEEVGEAEMIEMVTGAVGGMEIEETEVSLHAHMRAYWLLEGGLTTLKMEEAQEIGRARGRDREIGRGTEIQEGIPEAEVRDGTGSGSQSGMKREKDLGH